MTTRIFSINALPLLRFKTVVGRPNERGLQMKSAKLIGYVVKRFPRLSETFIVNELMALKSLGTEVCVFSLMTPEEQQQHDLLSELDVDVFYLPSAHALGALTIDHVNYKRDKHRSSSLKREVRTEIKPPVFPGKRSSQCAALQMQGAALAGLAQAKGVTHLHAHFASDAATVAMLASKLSDIPFSMTAHAKDIYHTYSEPELDRAFLASKLRSAQFTVTVSDYNRRYLNRLVDSQTPVHRLYNGIDLQKLAVHEGPREANLMVAVGRMVEKKGFPYLLDACSRLAAKEAPWNLVLIGDGPDRQSLQQQAIDLNLADRVFFAGALTQNEVLSWLRRASLFVLPCIIGKSGDRDGLPTVILESMAVGTPVISTRVAGIPEMIDHGQSGWLVAPEDSDQLANALHDALSLSSKQRRSIARSARRRMESDFDLYTNVQTLNRHFDAQEIIETTRRQECR